jgi:aminomethyltransferase
LLSPLDQAHRAAGAGLTDFGGWLLPLRFGSDLAEHHAVRQAAGLFDLSHMAQLTITGSGAGAGLNYALMGNHSAMPIGRASYSMILAPDGGIIDDLIVYRLGQDRFFIIANAGNRQAVVENLSQRLTGFAAEMTDQTLDRGLIAVQGPASPQVMAAAGLPEAADLGYYRAAEATLAGHKVILARTGYTGETGFEVSCERPAALELWDLLIRVGQPFGLVLAGLAARDSLRLEAAMPLYGHELDRDTTPAEGGQGAFLRSKEADFVGKAALARRPVTKHLVGLKGVGRRAARAGYPVFLDGQEVGQITSGMLSPTLGYLIALASLAGPEPAPGTALQVAIRGQMAEFTVTKLPFYSKEKI